MAIIKKSLDEFSSISGLFPCLPKSTVFLSNVSSQVNSDILNIILFVEGSFPIRYLRVPLISSRLFKKDCKILIERVKNRLDDWKNKLLSFAGRLQLIISVLSAMQIYW